MENNNSKQAVKTQLTKGFLIMLITRWLPWVKEPEEVRGSKRQGGREGEERREARLEESGFAVERSRLRISSRAKGANQQEDLPLMGNGSCQISFSC